MRVSKGTGVVMLAWLAYGCAEAPDGANYAAVAPGTPASASDGGTADAGASASDADATSPDDPPDAPDDAAGSDGGSADASRDASVAANDGGNVADAVADAAPDANGGPRDAGCTTGTIAVVAGNGTAAAAATWTAGGWSSATSLAGSLKSRPSVAATSTGFTTVGVASDDSLRFATRSASGWSQLAAVGAGITALDEARLVVLGGAAQLVFQAKGGANDTRYFFAAPSLGTWSTPEAIGGGTDVSFGPRMAAATTAGASLLIAQVGGNALLYARERSAGAWGASAQIGTTVARSDLPTAAVELSNGHILTVFSTDSAAAQRLAYTTRVSGAWTGSAAVFDNGTNRAFSSDPLALLALSAGRALLVFRGGDTNLYATTFDPVGVVPWTPPVAIAAQPVAAASAPSVAAGVCGNDAVVAFVDGAAVKLARLTGSTWSAAEGVPGLGTASFVGVATTP